MSLFLKETSFGESSCLGSIFKCYLFPVSSITEFNEAIEKIKKENHKARHIPYSYILKESGKCSDDGEPSLSAGKPTLDFLNSKSLKDCACVIARYYGGKDLGVGRLRNYFLYSLEDAFNKAKFIEKKLFYFLKISTDYETYSIISRLAKSSKFLIKNQDYSFDVTFSLYGEKEEINDFLLLNRFKFKKIEEGEEYIEI